MTSSIALFTLDMAEEAEKSVHEYQEAVDVKKALQKIKGGRSTQARTVAAGKVLFSYRRRVQI